MLPFSESIIILPTYNEADNICQMVEAIGEISNELSILVVDDGSPDGTAELVRGIQKNNTRVHLLERSGKMGLGTAYIAGFRWALERSFNYVFEMDCDFSHSPDDLPRLLEAAQSNDLVIGSRYIDGIRIINWPFSRLLLSYMAGLYTRFITGIPIFDTTGGFKCFHRRSLEALDLDRIFSNGYAFQLELNYKVWNLGLKIKEVPITFYERRSGMSKMSQRIVVEAIFAVVLLRLKKILRLL